MDTRIITNFYEKYKGAYAKRFYTPFLKENIFRIIDFKLEGIPYEINEYLPQDIKQIAYFEVLDETNGDTCWWDVDDCVIITNEMPIIEDDRVANINYTEYSGYNPYTGKRINEYKFA